jgi:peptide/nickel transport system substrate-binding protein
MQRTRIVAALATTMGLALAVSACGSNTTPSASTSTSASAGPASAGGTLNILSSLPVDHWDPQRVYIGANIEAGNRMFSRTLTTFGPVAKDGDPAEIVADAATDTGTVSSDAKEWKFTIKDGVKWEDGKAVTCEDFKYGISRTFAVDVITGGPNYAIQYLDIPKNKDGSSAYAGPYKKTGQALYDKAVTCAGTTITFKMAKPSGDFNQAVTMTAFGAFRADKDQGEKSNFAIFSDGPYKLEGTWTSSKGGTFVRNENWDASTDTIRKAYPDKIVFDESLTAETLYERLLADQGNDKNSIPNGDNAPATALANIATQAEGRYTIVPSPYTRYLVPNFKSKVMSNDKAREALALATDRAAYVTAYGGDQVAKATNSLINPALSSFPNTPLPAGDKGDPAKAKTILEQAGLTLPVKINVAYRKSDTNDKVFSGMKTGWDAAGFDTNLIGIPADQYYPTLQSPDSAPKYDVYWAGWGADFPSASTVIPQLLDSRSQISSGGPGQDYGYFDNADFNAGIDKAYALTGAEADKAWGQLDADASTKYFAVIPLINDQFVFAHGSNVEGAVVNITFTGYYDLATVSVKH